MTDFAHQMIADGLQTRSSSYEYPSFEQQLAAIQRQTRDAFRPASVSEAMSVPAIFGAVALISNTVGSLSMEAFRKGVRMDMDRAPRLIQRPDPFRTLRSFLRDTAYHLATRGEAWWWIAVRDPISGDPLSLYSVPPWEIMVEPNDANRLRPTIRWGDRVMRNEDMRQITYLPGRDGRGRGPLQECDVAVSVAVEAKHWAANFFSGSIPSMIGTTEQDMTEDELKAMDAQWLEKPSNLPRWLTNGLRMSDSPFTPEKAQLVDVQQASVGDVARMFSIPGSLIEYQMSGSSLRYQNDETVWTDFQRRCLSPHYLEPMEQEMSDLLTRSTVARFNLKQLLRADAKTRMEVHEKAIATGIYDAETAAREEGYAPGNVDYAPVPFAPPQAVPTSLPVDRDSLAPPPMMTPFRTAAREVRCPAGHLLAELASPPYKFTCFRCKKVVAA